MIKRPSVHDSDEDILRQQAEFLEQRSNDKIIPSASVINTEKELSSTKSNNEVSSVQMEINNTENIREQIANTFEAIPTNMKLERVSEKRGHSTDIKYLKFDSRGFPKAIRRDPKIQPKQGSIFAQHVKRLKKEIDSNQTSSKGEALTIKEKNLDGTIRESTNSIENLATTAYRSTVLSLSDRKQIHDTNLKTLYSMSNEEILAEKQKLMSTLDPVLIQYLKSQRSSNKKHLENRTRTIKEQNQAADSVIIEELQVPNKMLSMPEASDWLHFNELETHKLSWMKDISVPNLKKTEGFEARFDFNGYLLPYCVAQIDETNRHLYHHGDEPERPGYTLQELLLLSRSNVTQQRIVALTTLGNILSLEQTGIYDKVIDVPIEQIFFVLRVCIDDNTPSVLTAAVKALRNLVYFQVDETCLDNMLSFGMGLIQPVLAVDQALEDDNTVNDQQLAETNLIKCLTRTDILSRIRYIVNTIKPPIETALYCIEILIRLSRDSEFIIQKVLKSETLLSSLITNFMPLAGEVNLSQGYNMPLPQMIKLIRVLSSSGKRIATLLNEKFHVLDIIVSYLYDDHFSQNSFGMRLQVECLHFWTLMLHYELRLESLRQHQTLILKMLDYHFKNTDNAMSTTLIRQSHASALFILLEKAVERGFAHIFVPLTENCFKKWIVQFGIFDQFKCGNSQITSSILYYAASSNKQAVKIYEDGFLEVLLTSQGFDLATKQVLNGSLLLNNYETHKTTANLKSLEAATWFSSDHIVPVMQTNSCIPFLYALSSCILYDSSLELKGKFLDSECIKLYTKTLKASKYYFNTGNWFTRCESFLIMNLLKIALQIRNQIDPTLYYGIAVKCLCVFSSEQKEDMKHILDNIVFSSRFLPLEVAMVNVHVSERGDQLSSAWSHLDDIRTVYSEVLGLTNNDVDLVTKHTLDISIGNVIPVDWIYTPLVLLYSNQQKGSKTPTNEPQVLRIVLNCLRWILIYETHFEDLAGFISPTEKYVRLGCVFLGSDNLFLHEDIQDLLTQIYKFLLKHEAKIDFEEEISGLTNFKDFFVQLLEQYQGVSYGNKVFGNVLLLPLSKRHDVKYRKTLWSEYLGVVETFTVKREEVWLTVDDLIYPVDTEPSLIACYFKALHARAVPNNTIMYDIAVKNSCDLKKTIEDTNTQVY